MSKQQAHILLILFLLAVLHSPPLHAEGFALFADKDLTGLTLVATDPQAGTFRIADSSGNAQDGTINDLVGLEGAKVTEIWNTTIVVTTEEEYDWYGTTRTRTLAQIIPLAQAFEGGKGVR
ncbi:MAG: hypothetical protein ACYC9M_07535 [Desulfobulbaceae bacterium]